MGKQRLVVFLIWSLMLGFASSSWAAEKADFLGAEGAPAQVVKTLDRNVPRALRQRKQFRMLPKNPMDISMARLTLGCVGDTPDCMAKIGAMRQARWLFHVRVFPAGGKARALLRQIDAKTGKTAKEAVLIFARNQAKDAHTALVAKMFGDLPASAVVKKPTKGTRRKTAKQLAAEKKEAEEKAAAEKAAAEKKAAEEKIAAEKAAAEKAAAEKAAAEKKAAEEKAAAEKAAAEKKAAEERAAAERALAEKRAAEEKAAAEKAAIAKREAEKVPLVKNPQFWAWIAVGLAVASLGGVLGFGLNASALQNEANQKLVASQQGQPISYNTEIKPIEDSGRTSAIMANVFFGLAAAFAITGGVLFLIKPAKPAASAPPKTAGLPSLTPPAIGHAKSLLYVPTTP